MMITVDRIEGDFAVCETEDMCVINISTAEIPFEVKEGNVLIFQNGKYIIDEEYEADRRAKIFALQDSIFDE